MSAAAVGVALAMAIGCGRVSDPAEAWRRYVAAFARADTEGAWDALSAPTRRRFEEAARRTAMLPGRPPAEQARLFPFLNGRELRSRAARIETATVQGDSAQVRIVDDAGAVQTVSAVREGGGWKVDLTAELDAAARAAASPPAVSAP